MTLPPLVRLLRPHQYTKNLLVFAAPGAAGRLDDGLVLWRTVLAFVLFCLVSSAGYIANDIGDADADRLHPTKRNRPIASGHVVPRIAIALLVALTVAAFALAPVLGFSFVVSLAAYATLSGLYSAGVKRVPWLELAIVSAGFVLRAVAGGAATDTPLSVWFIIVVSASALLLITGKRIGELVNQGAGSGSRLVLGSYALSQLRALALVAGLVAVAAYVAWAAGEANDLASDSSRALFLRLTAVPFLVAIGRYVGLSWAGEGESPDVLVFRDPLVILCGVVWATFYSLGIYG